MNGRIISAPSCCTHCELVNGETNFNIHFLQDLLFCPDFTIVAPATVGPVSHLDFTYQTSYLELNVWRYLENKLRICQLANKPNPQTTNLSLWPQDTLEDFSIESIQHIWEKGVGFAYSRKTPPQIDSNRTEILKLLLTCFSETMYYVPSGEIMCLRMYTV